MLKRFVALAALALVSAAVLHTSAAGAASGASGFQDSTKNYRCAVVGSSVTCLVRHRTKSTCTNLWVASGTLKKTGLAVMNFGCFDKWPYKTTSFKTLAYGKKKTVGGVSCSFAKKTGVKCSNADKHGFGLSNTGSTTF